MKRDSFLAAMTETAVAFRVGECNEQLADISKLIQTDDIVKCQAYWFDQRRQAMTELYSRQQRRAM